MQLEGFLYFLQAIKERLNSTLVTLEIITKDEPTENNVADQPQSVL